MFGFINFHLQDRRMSIWKTTSDNMNMTQHRLIKILWIYYSCWNFGVSQVPLKRVLRADKLCVSVGRAKHDGSIQLVEIRRSPDFDDPFGGPQCEKSRCFTLFFAHSTLPTTLPNGSTKWANSFPRLECTNPDLAVALYVHCIVFCKWNGQIDIVVWWNYQKARRTRVVICDCAENRSCLVIDDPRVSAKHFIMEVLGTAALLLVRFRFIPERWCTINEIPRYTLPINFQQTIYLLWCCERYLARKRREVESQQKEIRFSSILQLRGRQHQPPTSVKRRIVLKSQSRQSSCAA